jgi:hypothetical protein
MPAATSADLGLRPAAPVSLRQIPSIAPPNMVGTGTAPTPKNRLLVIAVIALVFLALVVAVAAVIIVVRG